MASFYDFGGSCVSLFLAAVYAVTILLLIIAVAFFTVLERKVLAAVQRRRGPNVVGFWGLLQALADGLKLLLKEPVFVSGVNYYIFLCAPILLLSASLTLWSLIPLPGFKFGVTTSYSFIVVLLFSGLNSYAIILAGLTSNSRYSLIGGVRAIAQLISYEIPLSVSLLTLFCLQGSFSLSGFIVTKLIFLAAAFPAAAIFFISLLAETNRTPFDLPEAEAELVAGYNLEYSSILFSLFFLAEYSNILVASSLVSLLFVGERFFYISVVLICVFIIFIRASLPRYTFAQLIDLCWKSLFPLSVLTLIFSTILAFVLDCYRVDFVDPVLARTAELLLDNSRAAVAAEHGGAYADTLNVREPRAFAPGGQCPVSAAFTGLVLMARSPAAAGVDTNLSFVVDNTVPGYSLLIFFGTALTIVILLVGVNWVFINFAADNRKNSPYECGFEPVNSPVADFSPNFLSVALVFLIYDVEVLLTFPWAYSTVGHSASAVIAFVMFLILMLLGLAYEVLDDSFKVV